MGAYISGLCGESGQDGLPCGYHPANGLLPGALSRLGVGVRESRRPGLENQARLGMARLGGV